MYTWCCVYISGFFVQCSAFPGTFNCCVLIWIETLNIDWKGQTNHKSFKKHKQNDTSTQLLFALWDLFSNISFFLPDVFFAFLLNQRSFTSLTACQIASVSKFVYHVYLIAYRSIWKKHKTGMFSKRTDSLLRRLNITVSSIWSYQYCIYKPYCTHPQMNIFELIRGIYVGHLCLAFYFVHIILNLWRNKHTSLIKK